MRFMLVFVSALTVALATDLCANPPAPAPVPGEKQLWSPGVPCPDGLKPYNPATLTQSIAVTNGRDTIDPVRIKDLPDTRWHQSGGMFGVRGFRSDKYYLFKEQPREYIASIQVRNSLGFMQPNRALIRSYADGTRFDDVLSYEGKVFEHRVATKDSGKWSRRVIFSDKGARPPGYAGLTQSCASCHDEAGSGKYNAGLVPGSDTVLSDHLPWHLLGRR